MSELRIYHNPGCSKSRGALAILQERGVEFEIVEYLDAPPERAALERLLEQLPGSPADLVRQDKNFAKLGLDAADYQTSGAVVELLLAHPELMQRPVVVRGDRAVIARPPEDLIDLL